MTVCKRFRWLVPLGIGVAASAVLAAQPGPVRHSALGPRVTTMIPARNARGMGAARQVGAAGVHGPAVSHGAASIGGASAAQLRASMRGAAAINGTAIRRIRPR